MKDIALFSILVYMKKGAKLLAFWPGKFAEKNHPAKRSSSFPRMSAGVLFAVCSMAHLQVMQLDSFWGDSYSVNLDPVSDNSLNQLI